MLNDFLGIPEQLNDRNEKDLDISKAIVKLIDYPEWPVFKAELDRLYEEIKKTECEVYSQNPVQAHYDSGMKRTLIVIKNFIQSCKLKCEYGQKEKNQ